MVTSTTFSRLTLFCAHGWGRKWRSWGAVVGLERGWGCRAPQERAGRASPGSRGQDSLGGDGDGQGGVGHQPWELPGAGGQEGTAVAGLEKASHGWGRTGWGGARGDVKACGCPQGPDSTKACLLQGKRKTKTDFKVWLGCYLSLEQVFLGGTPAERRQGSDGPNYPRANWDNKEHLQTSHFRGGKHSQGLAGFSQNLEKHFGKQIKSLSAHQKAYIPKTRNDWAGRIFWNQTSQFSEYISIIL